MNVNTNANRKIYITVLSVISCFCVVLMHTGSFWSFRGGLNWLSANVIDGVGYFAVPVFFMISGANLINYRERYTTVQFFKKRILKTVLPFLVWNILGMVYFLIKSGIPEDFSAISVLKSLISVNVSVYWFFPVLFSTYLCIPILSLIPKSSRQNAFKYIILAGLLINILPAFLSNIAFEKNIFTMDFSFPYGARYTIYICLGYYIDNYKIEKKKRIIIYILGILGLLFTIAETQYLSIRDGHINTLYKEFCNLPTFLYSAAVFTLFKNIDFTKMQFIVKTADFFAPQTFGIYLIHFFVIDILGAILPETITVDILYRTLGAAAIFIITAMIVKLMQKIPIIKKIVP